MQTLVVGLDAATWKRIDPLLEAGELPTFRRLVESGVRGSLRSTMPPMTPLAWTSMVTGVNPGKHGVFDFFTLDRTTYDLETTDFTDFDRPALWDVFDHEGVNAGFFNFPIAFPPPERGSFFVSGIPSGVQQEITYPTGLRDRLHEVGFQVQPDTTVDAGLERYFRTLSEHLTTQADLLVELVDDHDLDHLWTVFMNLDWAQHYLWETDIDGTNAVDELYRQVDDVLDRLLKVAGDDVTTLVVSDHGAKRISGEVHLNSLLEDWGYLKPADEPTGVVPTLRSRLIDIGWAVGRNLPQTVRSIVKAALPDEIMAEIEAEVGVEHATMADDIDWANTSAFSYGYMGRIYVHLEESYEDGPVAYDDYESILAELESDLRSLRHPETGSQIVEDVLRADHVYDGDRVRDGADLVVVPTGWEYMLYGNFGDPTVHDPRSRIVDHDPEGILIASGPTVREGTTVDSDVTDIAPTLLTLHDLPVIDDIDGGIVEEIVGQEAPAESVTADRYAPGRTRNGRTDDQEAEARDRLEDLGYL